MAVNSLFFFILCEAVLKTVCFGGLVITLTELRNVVVWLPSSKVI